MRSSIKDTLLSLENTVYTYTRSNLSRIFSCKIVHVAFVYEGYSIEGVNTLNKKYRFYCARHSV